MASGTWTTTAAEDDAILAITTSNSARTGQPAETVPQFINRHIRHQVDFAVSEFSVAFDVPAYQSASQADKDAIQAILAKTKPTKGGKP